MGMKKKNKNGQFVRWALVSTILGLVGELFLSRNDLSWTLWVGLIIIVLAVGLYLFRTPLPEDTSVLFWNHRKEWMAAGVILVLAVFFRLYRIGEMPPGIFPELGRAALASERILREGWRPFYELYQWGFADQQLYYLLAGWFWLFDVSRYSIFGFSIFISLLALILSYFCFRQLSGTRVALLAFLMMAVMRWYLTFSRCGHSAFEVPFYIGGTLCFWLHAHLTDRKWAWALSLLFLISSVYSGLALRVFLMALFLWAFFEWRKAGKHRKVQLKRRYLFYFPAAFLITIPVWAYMVVNRTIGPGSEGQSLAGRIETEGFGILPAHIFRYFLMFHREADPWPIHNWSNHSVLDAVTAFLFLFGFCNALMGLKERSSFYPVSGFAVMSLPALLSSADAPVSRSVGVIPFVVLLAAQSLSGLEDAVRNDRKIRRWAFFFTAPLLVLVVVLNFKQYFYDQAQQPGECRTHWADATAVGERLALAPEKEIFLSPRFYRNSDVDMLAFDERTSFKFLVPWGLPGKSRYVEKAMLLVLDEGKTGLLQLLQQMYPAGKTEIFECVKGWPLVYFYRVPAGSPQWNGALGGLRGVYRLSGDWSGPPVLIRKDPILNFTFRNDFGLADFKTLSVRWTGIFQAPQTGTYSFLVLTTDRSSIWVDGKDILEGDRTGEAVVGLRPGNHRIQIDFQKLSGVDTAFNLLWKPPGASNYQIIPFWQWASSPKTTVLDTKP